mmetsp:Transcript_34763/g.33089  ORF Transcript_34763/g.33089 Transcript_34763/m.33089 type:complete len:137 (+) Transcript_34763:717-1127(+)
MISISEMKSASEVATAPAEFNDVIFPSRPKEGFRITCGPLNEKERWNLWLENKRTRLQYELLEIRVENYGKEMVPATIVYSLLLKALATCEVTKDGNKMEVQDAQVDCEYSVEGITINLTLNMCSFSFILTHFLSY